MPRLSAAASPGTPSVWSTLVRGLAQLGVAAAAMALLLLALLVGLLLALGLVAWALLRGRRPARGVFTTAFSRARRRSSRADGEVIDIEAREVSEPVAVDARRPSDRR